MISTISEQAEKSFHMEDLQGAQQRFSRFCNNKNEAVDRINTVI